MSPDQVREVCGRYAAMLADRCSTRPVRNIAASDMEGRLDHLHWMCLEIPTFLESTQPFETDSSRSRVEKAMRWLGFIQGALMAMNILTIEEMKEDNRA